VLPKRTPDHLLAQRGGFGIAWPAPYYDEESMFCAPNKTRVKSLIYDEVREVYANRPDFPAPVFLSPGPKGRAPKRWKRKDIYEHFGLND
jgi:hypothetical protein